MYRTNKPKVESASLMCPVILVKIAQLLQVWLTFQAWDWHSAS